MVMAGDILPRRKPARCSWSSSGPNRYIVWLVRPLISGIALRIGGVVLQIGRVIFDKQAAISIISPMGIADVVRVCGHRPFAALASGLWRPGRGDGRGQVSNPDRLSTGRAAAAEGLLSGWVRHVK